MSTAILLSLFCWRPRQQTFLSSFVGVPANKQAPPTSRSPTSTAIIRMICQLQLKSSDKNILWLLAGTPTSTRDTNYNKRRQQQPEKNKGHPPKRMTFSLLASPPTNLSFFFCWHPRQQTTHPNKQNANFNSDNQNDLSTAIEKP
ncbi:MAG: hypothetical protein JSS80_09860 [Bacteroidetes bacterium]|nr:hypothetical protein [Bacteroidota bacterium]